MAKRAPKTPAIVPPEDDREAVAHLPNTPEAPPKQLSAEELTAYLEFELQPLKDRRRVILDSLLEVLAVYGEKRIEDDEQYASVAERLGLAAALERTAEDRRKEIVRPFLDGQNGTNRWFKSFGQPLADPRARVQAMVDDYATRTDNERRAVADAEAKKLREDAARLADEAAERLREAAEAPHIADAQIDAHDALAAASAAAEGAERQSAIATGSAADLTRVRTETGVLASARKTWKARITDATLIPRRFLVIDPALIGAAIKAAPKAPDGRPLIAIDGVEIYADISVQTRGA